MDIKKVSKKGRKLPYITNSQGKTQVFRETIPVGISTLLTNILDCKWSLESWDIAKLTMCCPIFSLIEAKSKFKSSVNL